MTADRGPSRAAWTYRAVVISRQDFLSGGMADSWQIGSRRFQIQLTKSIFNASRDQKLCLVSLDPLQSKLTESSSSLGRIIAVKWLMQESPEAFLLPIAQDSVINTHASRLQSSHV